MKNRKQNSVKPPVKQGGGEKPAEANKINASTNYDFSEKNLTPYGGLLPVITMLEKIGFLTQVEECLTVNRQTRAMPIAKFVLAIVLGLYVGFARLNQLRFVSKDPMLTGILEVAALPVQSTFWRFLASLHINVQRQVLKLQRKLRENALSTLAPRVWAAANVRLKSCTLDTDTTVHTLYGNQMGRARLTTRARKAKRAISRS